MCFSGFLYFLTEITVHLEKKKETFTTFAPVFSNGNPLSFSKPQLRNTSPCHTSESVGGPPLKPFLLSFFKVRFRPRKRRRDAIRLFPLPRPRRSKFDASPL